MWLRLDSLGGCDTDYADGKLFDRGRCVIGKMTEWTECYDVNIGPSLHLFVPPHRRAGVI